MNTQPGRGEEAEDEEQRARARPDLWRGLGTLVEPPTPERAGAADALGLGLLPDPEEHTELFLLQLAPYASVYVGPEGMLGGEARERVAGFWQAVGRRPPGEPDHLACLLGLYASLCEEEMEATDRSRARLARHARRALLHEHLACWVPPYLLALEDVAGPFYRGWAAILGRALAEEAEALDAPAALPAHLAEAPGMEASGAEGPGAEGSGAEGSGGPEPSGKRPRDGAPPEEASPGPGDLTARILAPVRSGLLLTRSDLVRAAREQGLPLRIGERRFALRGMFSADPEATCAWLADEARAWAVRHAGWSRVGGSAARFWKARAEATGQLLRGGAPGAGGTARG